MMKPFASSKRVERCPPLHRASSGVSSLRLFTVEAPPAQVLQPRNRYEARCITADRLRRGQGRRSRSWRSASCLVVITVSSRGLGCILMRPVDKPVEVARVRGWRWAFRLGSRSPGDRGWPRSGARGPLSGSRARMRGSSSAGAGRWGLTPDPRCTTGWPHTLLRDCCGSGGHASCGSGLSGWNCSTSPTCRQAGSLHWLQGRAARSAVHGRPTAGYRAGRSRSRSCR